MTAQQSPAARQAAIARDVLERVMLDIKRMPGSIDRRLVADVMEEAMGRLVRIVDQPMHAPDHLDRLGLAQRDVKRARQVVEDQVAGTTGERYVRSMRGVEAALAAAREATIEAVVATQNDASIPTFVREPFGGSLGSPRLHHIDRDPLQTLVDTEAIRAMEHHVVDDAAASEPRDDEDGLELSDEVDALRPEDDEEDPDFMRVPLPLEVDADKRLQMLAKPSSELDTTVAGIDGEIAQARRIVRDCLEEIGNLGNLRILKAHERFGVNVLGFEQRLLNDLDAVIALSHPFYLLSGNQARFRGLDVLTEVLAYSRGAFTADPVRTFARAFVLSCVEGQDAVRAAILGLKQSHPLTHRAQTQAFSLGTNPGIVPAMKRLCADDDGAMVRVGLDVLLLRNEVDFAIAVPLLEHPRDAVRARAARCLGLVDETQAATSQLNALLETEIEDEVIVAAVESLVLLGSPDGLPHVRERLAEELEDPGMLTEPARKDLMDVLALCGGRKDAELLAAHMQLAPLTAEALGWHGHIGHVEPLIEMLKTPRHSGDRRKHEIVSRALHRITGAELQEPRMQTELDFYAVTIDAPMWELWWREHQDQFQADVRYRFGQPYTAMSTLLELQRDDVPMGYRERCARELAIVHRSGVHLNVRDWARRQASALHNLRNELEADTSTEESAGAPRHPAGAFVGDRRV